MKLVIDFILKLYYKKIFTCMANTSCSVWKGCVWESDIIFCVVHPSTSPANSKSFSQSENPAWRLSRWQSVFSVTCNKNTCCRLTVTSNATFSRKYKKHGNVHQASGPLGCLPHSQMGRLRSQGSFSSETAAVCTRLWTPLLHRQDHSALTWNWRPGHACTHACICLDIFLAVY